MQGANFYYSAMSERYAELTGAAAQPDSDVGIRFAVLAQELERLEQAVSAVEMASWPQTAQGEALDHHAQQRGLWRKAPVRAMGTLRFMRSVPAVQDILIPAGAVCSTAGDEILRYITTEEAVIPAGESQVEVPALAEVGGERCNCAAGAVSVMVTPVPYTDSVSNPAPFGGGSDEESDEELRARLLESYAVVSNGTNSAYYHKLALGQEGVYSAAVLPRSRGLGTVDIVLGAKGGTVQQAVVQELTQKLAQLKEINVDIQVSAAVERRCDISLSVEFEQNCGGKAGLDTVRLALLAELEEMQVGQPLRTARLIGVVMRCPGVCNCSLRAPAGDLKIGERELVVAGEIAVLEEELG